MRELRLILNGKAAGDAGIRDAVSRVRDLGHPVEVRVTWEAGDGARFAAEACGQGVAVVVAGGGDGTVNEVVNGVLRTEENPAVAVAVVPLGTANDFATGCGIPRDPFDALALAATGAAVAIDVGTANGGYFVNVASGGFGARITATTPPELKRRFGSAAYALMGFRSLLQQPRAERTRFVVPDSSVTGTFLLGAIGNGRQAGGGFQVAPKALLDDGLLDILLVRDVGIDEVDLVIGELLDPTAEDNRYTIYRREPWLEVCGPEDGRGFLNLDGEPFAGSSSCIRFGVLHRRLRFVLPRAAAPLLQQPIEPGG
jgi:lipid kinase YegS